ncbi:MAG: mechanosensitive ion channel domain-containing protein [Woeseiaceae bacterium]
MSFRPVILVLLLLSLPAIGQGQRFPDITASDDITVSEINSIIDTTSSREDLDAEIKARVLELLRNARTQVQVRLEANAAAAEFKASLNTAPVELEKLRKELEESPSAGLASDASAIDETATLEELQQELAAAIANLTAADAQLADLREQVEAQISRPAVARERLGQLRGSQQELESLGLPLAVPGEPRILSDARNLAARLRRTAQAAEINRLEQELLSQPIRLSLLQAKRDLSLRSQEESNERVEILRDVVNDRRQSAAVLAQEAAAAAELAAAGKHRVLRVLTEENAELTRELPRRIAEIDAANEQLEQVRSVATDIERRLSRSEQLFEIGGLTSTIGRLMIEENRTLPQLSKYRAQLRERGRRLGEIGLAQIRIQEQRRDLIAFDQKAQQLESEVAAEISDPEELAEIAVEIRQLLRERRDLLLQVEDSYRSYLQTLGDLDIEQRRLLETTERYKEFLARNLLWIPSAPVIFMGPWDDVGPAFERTVSPNRWLGAVTSLVDSIGQRIAAALLIAALFFVLLVLRRPLARRQALINEKVRRMPEDSIGLTLASLGVVVLRALPVPLLMVAVAWLLGHAPEPSVFTDALARSLSVTAPFLANALVFGAISARDGILHLHFGWQEANLVVIRRQLRRFVTIGTPLIFISILLFLSDVASDQAIVGRLTYIAFLFFLAAVIYPLTHPNSGVVAAYYRRHPERWMSKLRWLWFGLSVGLPLLLGIISALGYLYTSAIVAGLMLETIWRLLALGVVYLILLRWFALARRKLARQLAYDEFQAKLAAQKNESQQDSEGEMPAPVDEPLDIEQVDQQTKRLLRSVLIVVAAAVVWSIWADVLPAFAVLDQVALWNQTTTVDGAQVIAPVTLKDLLFALLIGVVTAIISRNLPGLMEIAVLQRLTLAPGSRYAIKTLVRYVVVTIGTIWVLSIIGWNWSQIQWLVAALSVGLGFGLQEIVANFVSGLVILFERPVRVGDTVTVGQLSGTVSQVRIRATTITDWDRKEIIVPNKAFITEQVINWTLTDPITRIVVNVGISYGSDVELARKVMLETLTSLSNVLDEPEPRVYFTGFGDSSLDFTLHAFLRQLADRLPTIDEIHRSILSALRANGIEIPFPQRDLHIRTNPEAK